MSKKGARFSDSSTTKKIHADWWEKDEFVEIKKLNYGQQRALETASMTISKKGVSLKGMDTAIHVDELQMTTLELGVKTWNFTDDAGNPVPSKRANFRMLNEEDGAFIVAEISAYNKKKVTQEDVDEAVELLDEELAKGKDKDTSLIKLMEENIKELEDTLQEQRDSFPETETSD